MIDAFQNRADDLTKPAKKAAAVTKHDSNEIDVPQALFVGTGGDLVCRLMGDTANVTFKNVPNGAILPVRPKIIANATTASDILALY
jgi:hypothetical protein